MNWLFVLTLVTLPAILSFAGTTSHLSFDGRLGVRNGDGSVSICYDASWCTNGVLVKITANGQEIASGVAGAYMWTPTSAGVYQLALSIYNESGDLVGLEKVWCVRGEELVVPDGMSVIGEYAFANGTFSSVTIPNSVTNVSPTAFVGCSNVVDVSWGTGLCNSTFVKLSTTGDWTESVNGVYRSKAIGDYGSTEMSVELYLSRAQTFTFEWAVFSGTDYDELEYYVDGVLQSRIRGLQGKRLCETALSVGEHVLRWRYHRDRSGSSGEGYAYVDASGIETMPMVKTVFPDSFEKISSFTFLGESNAICAEMFAGCAALESVTIPHNVKYVGMNAFCGCKQLSLVNTSSISDWIGICFANAEANPLHMGATFCVDGEEVSNLEIPDGTVEILDYAFQGGQFMSITLNSDIMNVGLNAFGGCVNLSCVNSSGIADWIGIHFANAEVNPLHLGAMLCVDGKEVKELVIPDGAAEIGEHAFVGGAFTLARIPNSVMNVASTAFSGCENIVSITVPSWVNVAAVFPDSKDKIAHVTLFSNGNVPASAYRDCIALERVDVDSLGDWLSLGFGDAEANPLHAGAMLYVKGKEVTKLEIPDGTSAIGDYAFVNGAFTSVTIPGGVTNIGVNAFAGCASIADITLDASISRSSISWERKVPACDKPTGFWTDIGNGQYRSNQISNNGSTEMGVSFHLMQSQICTFRWKVSSEPRYDTLLYLIDGNPVTSISGSQDWEEKEVSLAAGKHTIVWRYSKDCLQSSGEDRGWVDISDLLALTTLKVEKMNEIGSVAVVFPDSYKSVVSLELTGGTPVPDGFFVGCESLESVAISSGVTSIGEGAFSGCFGLRSVVIPASVEKLSSTFSDSYAKIESVVICDGVTNIGDCAFCGCIGLKSVLIPSSVTSIGERAFQGCNALADA